MPFLAHALGTFIGAFSVGKIAQTKHMMLGLIAGGFFFLGGLAMVFQLPSPVWFSLTDLGLAYLPMAYLGIKLSAPKK